MKNISAVNVDYHSDNFSLLADQVKSYEEKILNGFVNEKGKLRKAVSMLSGMRL